MSMSLAGFSLRIEDEFKDIFGTPEDAQKLEDFADALAKAIIDEIKENATLTLAAGDIPVPASGLLDSTFSACTGAAQNAAVVLTGKID